MSGIEESHGYVRDYRHNVLSYINTTDYEEDLMEGAGSELKSKFSALYSSSALVVNTFTTFKQNLSKIEFIGMNNFKNARFERPFKTGQQGTSPTLDFSLENDNVVIGIESKYLETLDKKEAKFRDSYFSNKLINTEMLNLINKYNGSIAYLDYAQLLKHSIGLIKYSMENNKKAFLVYIYWTPKNYERYKEYKLHEQELSEFKKDMG